MAKKKLFSLSNFWGNSAFWAIITVFLSYIIFFIILNPVLKIITTGFKGICEWLEEPRTVLVFFQNTHELRPTGGFMGSYAIIQMNKFKITDWETYDIYEGDRNNAIELIAPYGVHHYLSDGGPWGLADSNWDSDWTNSLSTIETIMTANQTWPSPDLVVALNLTIAEKLLDAWGGVYLPDYQITVTGQNFAKTARAQRTEWFVGSHQKQNFLQHFANQLQIRLKYASPEEIISLFQILIDGLNQKQIQLSASSTTSYLTQASSQLSQSAKHPHQLAQFSPLQQFFELCHWSGRWPTPTPHTLPIIWTESNVSINKANDRTSRHITTYWQTSDSSSPKLIIKSSISNYHPQPTPSELENFYSRINIQKQLLELKNSGQTLTPAQTQQLYQADLNSRFYYANYQRLAIPVSWELVSWTADNPQDNLPAASIIPENSQLIYNQGYAWQEFGHLFIIEESQKLNFEIILAPVSSS